MLTRLLILWLLSESPMHGYRIKRTLDDEAMRFWFSVDYGSVYAVLRTLEREGLVRQDAVEQEGARPPRRRYEITTAGREALADLLREAWVRLSDRGDPVDLALAARPELPEEEVEDLLGRRAEALQQRVRELRGLARSAPAPELVPRHVALAEAELRWIESMRPGSPAGEESDVEHPTDVQLIANLIVRRPDGRVLFIRYHDDDERWWLPGEDLEAYEHPDERAGAVLETTFPDLRVQRVSFHDVESFRGRRGWHVVFHYLVEADGDASSEHPTEWFEPSELPRTMHGRWEHDAVGRVLEDAAVG
jgi:DNA-binding PadR family transcriptional regulator/ADP-ribose pyrophosphatase YjhB (NUDIX family)